MPLASNANGVAAEVTSVSGVTYIIRLPFLGALPTDISGITVSRVYHVGSPYQGDSVLNIQYVQSTNILYLFCPGHRPRKLIRKGATDWVLELLDFQDGPFDELNDEGVRLTPSGTGNAALLSRGSASSPSIKNSNSANNAFDTNPASFWESGADQTGSLRFNPTTPFVCRGYAIYIPTENRDANFTSKDYAPSDFELHGYKDSSWVLLDSKADYVLYDGNRSLFFEINNAESFERYELRVKKVRRNGSLSPRVSALVLAEETDSSFNLTVNNTKGINSDKGFLSTDVGRQIRLRGADSVWRAVNITSVLSRLIVSVKLQGAPLLNTEAISDWRLGLWSDTTGWPTTGLFEQDRLLLAGASGSPNSIVSSVQGSYEDMSPTDEFGVVLDDHGFSINLLARKLAAVRWLSSDSRGVVVGTGSGMWVLSRPDKNKSLGPLNIEASIGAQRDASPAVGISIDKQVLFSTDNGRDIREFAYNFDSDGYRAPSLSLFSSHLGADPFLQLEYAPEPYTIVWVLHHSGKLSGLTYNREQNVVGWHTHDFGGVIESITVIPDDANSVSTLWMSIKRQVGGASLRYIERLSPLWDTGMSLKDTSFCDSSLSQEFVAAVTKVYGLSHLEGKSLSAVLDDRAVSGLVVSNGSVDLPHEARVVTLGLPYTSEGETTRFEAGAADGTSVGKTQRINRVSFSLWDTSRGEVGVRPSVGEAVVWQTLPENSDVGTTGPPPLFTGDTESQATVAGYGVGSTALFRQVAPLPFNLVSIALQLKTEDRG
jgi:hypothetical protein